MDGNSKSGLHLGRIADAMTDWRARIAEHLGLSYADVNVIETAYPGKLDLQKYVTICNNSIKLMKNILDTTGNSKNLHVS